MPTALEDITYRYRSYDALAIRESEREFRALTGDIWGPAITVEVDAVIAGCDDAALRAFKRLLESMTSATREALK